MGSSGFDMEDHICVVDGFGKKRRVLPIGTPLHHIEIDVYNQFGVGVITEFVFHHFW